MFSGGDYDEVARWLLNFATAHAKRENLRVEAEVDAGDDRVGQSYGVRLRLGEQRVPPVDRPPIELSFTEVASGRGSLAWCDALAGRVRGLARGFAPAGQAPRQTAPA